MMETDAKCTVIMGKLKQEVKQFMGQMGITTTSVAASAAVNA
jgi:hypothetical protein